MGLVDVLAYKLWSWRSAMNYQAKSVLTSDTVPPTNASETTISWDDEEFDNGNMVEYVTNPERITIKQTGIYFVVGALYFQGSVNAGFGQIKMYDSVGGVVDYGLGYSGIGEDNKVLAFGITKLTKNDYLYVRYYQNCNYAKILKAYTWFGAYIIGE